ncbi:tripartite tricarboxylate transporter TctB family protein [Sinanaerobacter chloroacetimidivorans]|uniref:Tripartite tricarboxylate transporter TctB family protein n=1 Tax=Sinanaerobacter chloroacetimidivorans TaxID=2818044 RepID=A0A8J7W098_9FIRM|nr:tripartite tricarboxylate transporter TctB family protein [Sinanaerobacter chloroacetimidivorans]MBR0596880.1 tripartite tricarboxylate transporter TctB family protein [Sinanaerobacter chloroacetimidivorans]
MKLKYNSEIISGAVFLVAAAVLWLLIPSQINTMETSAINAQTVPKIVIGGMGLFSLGLLLQGIFTLPKKEVVLTRAGLISDCFRKELKSVVYAIILLAYLAALTWMGFLISTVLLTIAILLFYGARKWYYYAIPLAMVGVVYFVFKMLLRVSLP